ncbi:MAG: alpha-amylase, partial [Flavobacteriales bacterium]|nr:alpha-amylase [Flavobacteriales bacterium]
MRATSLLLLLNLTLFSLHAFSQAAAEIRVEPPHWWVGMNNDTVQVMLHGNFDTDTEVELRPYAGVELIATTRPSEHYVFIDLIIANDTEPGTLEIDLIGTWNITLDYSLKARKPGSGSREGFDASDVLYLITPDRFANGDTENDTVEEMKEAADRSFHGGRHGGDLRGIIDHLDYIDQMGFTAIWINPILENDMPRWSYHGYSTTDFYRIDPRYGSLEEYKELVTESEKRGIKIIQDMIENHCGSEHWWMDDLPFKDWINGNGEYRQTSHQHEVVQDPYASDYDTDAFNKGWFVRTMPDLNQQNPYMATYLIQNSIWWIEEVGLSGIRQDTYPYADKTFMAQWAKAILSEYPLLNIVGEEWNYEVPRVAYWQDGSSNEDGYRSYLPSVMDFPLQLAIGQAFDGNAQNDEGLKELYRCLALDFLYPAPQDLVTFADNHDMDRIYARIGEDLERWKM